MASVPRLDNRWEEVAAKLGGQQAELSVGCVYYDRCPIAAGDLGDSKFRPTLLEVERDHAVADALGYSFHIDVERGISATPRQQLLDYLRRKHVLLMMDNYEHLLVEGAPRNGQQGSDGVGFVTDLLSAAPGVKVLVTARASLKVQGEYLYPLTGLHIPEATLPAPADARRALGGYSAIDLFLQVAQQVRPDFELRSHDVVHVVHICRLKQGMPLAILLAAEEIFVPLIYGLPAAALLLADQGMTGRAVEVYACVSRHEFVANSRWFEDVAGRHIADVAASLPQDVVAAARARGRERDLEAIARELLDDLAAWH